MTLFLGVAVVLGGTLVGLGLVVAQRSPFRPLRAFSNLYVNLFRAIPPLVLLSIVYFFLPLTVGLSVDPITAAIIALTLNLAPFASECIRAGIESIPSVQYESATVLGIRGWRLWRFVIGPQAIRRTLPSLVGQWVTSLKLTSLAATIGVPELWHVTGRVAIDTTLPLETRLVGAALYVLIVWPCISLIRMLEQWFGIKGVGPVVGM